MDKKISIYFFGDDFRGRSIGGGRGRSYINLADDNGNRRVRIHAVAFPALVQARHPTAYRFAALMRELTYRNTPSPSQETSVLHRPVESTDAKQTL